MNYHQLLQLRRHHPGWRLLQADHAPLVVAFLETAFVSNNARGVAASVLEASLDDLLFTLRESEGEEAFPRSANAYLADWAGDERGWLRRYYPPDSDEPHYDLSPAAEKAIAWVKGLVARDFVGTESRLMTIFSLLQQMLEGTETDRERRVAELRQRRDELDRLIARAEAGDLELLDDTALRERFQQLAGTARELLSDFREVEHNFRQLDRAAREQITTWEGRKGELLETIFGERDAITDSDQGRTFRGFWELLMSPSRQESLTAGLERLFELDAIQAMAPDPRLRKVHFDWLEAGEHTQRTVARLSQQLRRFLDDQVYLENRRIMQLVRSIEGHALALRDDSPADAAFMELEEPRPQLNLPMERRLFTPPLKPRLDSRVSLGEGALVDPGALYDQVLVDPARLRANIHASLRGRSQVTLQEVLETHPLAVGLAELVGYLSLAGDGVTATFDEGYEEVVSWEDDDGKRREARVPRVIYLRDGAENE